MEENGMSRKKDMQQHAVMSGRRIKLDIHTGDTQTIC